jgi:excisionase family DNA binding protein
MKTDANREAIGPVETAQQPGERVAPVLLTTKQAADLVNCGERTLWRWSRSGIAPKPVTIGGTLVRYRRDELLAWINAGCPAVDERRPK